MSRLITTVGVFSSDTELMAHLAKVVRELDLPVESKSVMHSLDAQPRIHRRLQPHQLETLIADYEAGTGVVALAAKYQIHRFTVSTLLKEAGVTIRSNSPSESQIRCMISLYEAGSSMGTVGHEVGFDGSTVQKYLRLHQVAIRGSKGSAGPVFA